MHACTQNQCRQGRAACPCPQACQLPERTATTTRPSRALPVLAAVWLAVALFSFGIAAAIAATHGA